MKSERSLLAGSVLLAISITVGCKNNPFVARPAVPDTTPPARSVATAEQKDFMTGNTNTASQPVKTASETAQERTRDIVLSDSAPEEVNRVDFQSKLAPKPAEPKGPAQRTEKRDESQQNNFAAGQQLATFELEYMGKPATVTQDVDSKYLGFYETTGGRWRWKYNISKNPGQSYYWVQTLNNHRDSRSGYAYNQEGKTTIKWGFLVEDGEVYKNGSFEKFWYGKKQKITGARIVVMERDGESVWEYLSEIEGKLHLGTAEKQ